MSTLSLGYRKKGGKRPMSMKKRGGKSAMSMRKRGGKSAMSMKKRGGKSAMSMKKRGGKSAISMRKRGGGNVYIDGSSPDAGFFKDAWLRKKKPEEWISSFRQVGSLQPGAYYRIKTE